jgi:hypothetical protein
LFFPIGIIVAGDSTTMPLTWEEANTYRSVAFSSLYLWLMLSV